MSVANLARKVHDHKEWVALWDTYGTPQPDQKHWNEEDYRWRVKALYTFQAAARAKLSVSLGLTGRRAKQRRKKQNRKQRRRYLHDHAEKFALRYGNRWRRRARYRALFRRWLRYARCQRARRRSEAKLMAIQVGARYLHIHQNMLERVFTQLQVAFHDNTAALTSMGTRLPQTTERTIASMTKRFVSLAHLVTTLNCGHRVHPAALPTIGPLQSCVPFYWDAKHLENPQFSVCYWLDEVADPLVKGMLKAYRTLRNKAIGNKSVTVKDKNYIVHATDITFLEALLVGNSTWHCNAPDVMCNWLRVARGILEDVAEWATLRFPSEDQWCPVTLDDRSHIADCYMTNLLRSTRQSQVIEETLIHHVMKAESIPFLYLLWSGSPLRSRHRHVGGTESFHVTVSLTDAVARVYGWPTLHCRILSGSSLEQHVDVLLKSNPDFDAVTGHELWVQGLYFPAYSTALDVAYRCGNTMAIARLMSVRAPQSHNVVMHIDPASTVSDAYYSKASDDSGSTFHLDKLDQIVTSDTIYLPNLDSLDLIVFALDGVVVNGTLDSAYGPPWSALIKRVSLSWIRLVIYMLRSTQWMIGMAATTDARLVTEDEVKKPTQPWAGDALVQRLVARALTSWLYDGEEDTSLSEQVIVNEWLRKRFRFASFSPLLHNMQPIVNELHVPQGLSGHLDKLRYLAGDGRKDVAPQRTLVVTAQMDDYHDANRRGYQALYVGHEDTETHGLRHQVWNRAVFVQSSSQ